MHILLGKLLSSVMSNQAKGKYWFEGPKENAIFTREQQ